MERVLISLSVSILHGAEMPERMTALISQDEDTIHAVFGPELDLPSRYVAQACDTAKVIPGAKLGLVQGCDIDGSAHVAVMDELGHAWALTGPVTDKHAYAVAQAITEHPAFLKAVITAREGNMVLLRPEPT